MGDELAAGGMLHGGGDAHLDAELVGPVRLALTDALDLRRVQGIDLAAALEALLFQHAPGQEQRSHERLPQKLISDDVTNQRRLIMTVLTSTDVNHFRHATDSSDT